MLKGINNQLSLIIGAFFIDLNRMRINKLAG
jgi:hypothetical protein